MPSLGTTTAALKAQREAMAKVSRARPARLRTVKSFGSNPGELTMHVHAPADLPSGRPLVVALHGCTQNAEAYQHGAGWGALAERHGFALLVPQQEAGNNPGHCFNWFQGADTSRGHGEVESIRQMIETAAVAHGSDPRQIYISGLSAGGAMTAALLAAYPEIFAGGAIIGGLPAGAAHGMVDAISVMHHGRNHSAEVWGEAVRSASNYPGPWPTVSIWHGDEDPTVVRANAEDSILQWTNVHGLTSEPDTDIWDGNVRRRVWKDTEGREAVKAYTIRGMGHGTPIAAAEDGVGHAGAFFLDVGVDSSTELLRNWGIAEAGPDTVFAPRPRAKPAPHPLFPDVSDVIDQALRAAGLKR